MLLKLYGTKIVFTSIGTNLIQAYKVSFSAYVQTFETPCMYIQDVSNVCLGETSLKIRLIEIGTEGSNLFMKYRMFKLKKIKNILFHNFRTDQFLNLKSGIVFLDLNSHILGEKQFSSLGPVACFWKN